MSWMMILVSFALRLSKIDFMRSCDIGRGTDWASSASMMAVASKGPMRIGRYRLPSRSLRITTGSCVSKSMPSLSTFICRMQPRLATEIVAGLRFKNYGSYRSACARDRTTATWGESGKGAALRATFDQRVATVDHRHHYCCGAVAFDGC